MTMITKFSTKKSLRKALDVHPQCIIIEDPALMPEWRPYGSSFRVTDIKPGDSITVTNHPKRSWFASIHRNADGSFKVE